MDAQWKNHKHLPFLVITIITIQLLIHVDGKQPHIIFIIADDLGWNDVGFHGSNQIPTPNIDALAYSGVILNKYYVNPICTPSRSALMTGKYPIHTGMQHTVLYAAEPRGLPLKEKLLPEYLRDLGYSNHIVGKWHLGHYKKEYTPLYRGFESHVGFWSGRHDYFDHTSIENNWTGLDMRNGMNPGFEFDGQYSTDLFAKEAVNVIESHNSTKPLFLYLAHAAVHSGNPYNPLPAPEDVVAKFDYIENYSRRRFAAMVSKLDDSVGEVVKALSSKNMLEDSIIVFTSDNGGPAEGFNLNYASNWPLKGVKNTLWEGGVRGAALIWSKSLEKRKRVSEQMMHITDWLPTLYTAAGGNYKDISNGLDAIDMWEMLSKDEESNRKEILHNIDDIYGSASLTSGIWKIHKGTNYNGVYDKWYGPSGRDGNYNASMIYSSNSGIALDLIKESTEVHEITKLRKEATVQCNTSSADNCHPLKRPCLFNIRDDPCEHKNLADMSHYRTVMNELLHLLAKYNSTAVPPGNLPLDDRANPKYWNDTWTNFGDYPYISSVNY